MKFSIPIFLMMGLSAIVVEAATYTWLGTAGDGNWLNAANWDANGVPVDRDLGTATLEQTNSLDNIIIGGSAAPTANIPTFDGGDFTFRTTLNAPEIQLLNGTFTVSQETIGGGIVHVNPWSSSVGDGDTGNGSAILNYTINSAGAYNRDPDGQLEWIINADGTLNFNSSDPVLDMAANSNRTVRFIVNGGIVNFNSALQLEGFVGNYFDLTVGTAAVTADFGGDYADLASVLAAIGGNAPATGDQFISSTDLTLGAVDNGNGTYTVLVIPEPSAFLLSLVGLITLSCRRRRHVSQ